jgi:hypothetical protein
MATSTELSFATAVQVACGASAVLEGGGGGGGAAVVEGGDEGAAVLEGGDEGCWLVEEIVELAEAALARDSEEATLALDIEARLAIDSKEATLALEAEAMLARDCKDATLALETEAMLARDCREATLALEIEAILATDWTEATLWALWMEAVLRVGLGLAEGPHTDAGSWRFLNPGWIEHANPPPISSGTSPFQMTLISGWFGALGYALVLT